jgi:hypothetical protein
MERFKWRYSREPRRVSVRMTGFQTEIIRRLNGYKTGKNFILFILYGLESEFM